LQGVKQVKKSGLNAKFVFIKPPSIAELEKRLRGRGTETEEAIQKRLEQALKELEFAETSGIYDKIIVNDDLKRAYKELEEYLMAQLELNEHM
jgi:guanylate kinase